MSCGCDHPPSPYNTNNKCQQYSCLAELSALANPAFPSLWGVEDNNPLVDTVAQQHGEDFVVPDATDVFLFSSDNTHLGGFQLPTFPEGNTYFSGGGLDEPGLSSEYFINMSENGHKADVSTLQEYYGTNYASTYDHLTTLGKTMEIQSKRNDAAAGSAANMRVGRYSVEERKDRILRYIKKRNQRNFNKTIKYACRKTLADRRIRVRGRFAKNNEEVAEMNHSGSVPLIDESTISPPRSYNDYYTDYQFHQSTKQDVGEEWLQEAITSLMYNYIPQWQAGLPLQ